MMLFRASKIAKDIDLRSVVSKKMKDKMTKDRFFEKMIERKLDKILDEKEVFE